MSLSYFIQKDERDKNYEIKILESTVSTCRMNEGNRGNFLVKMLMDDFNQYFDFNFTCPFPKQKFGCYNFVPNAKFLPPILFGRTIGFLLIVKFDGKLLDSKKTVWLFSYKIMGKIHD
jgi:hypothetical protein